MSISLTQVAEEQLALARTARRGRSAYTVYGGSGHVLRQTMLALAAGEMLDDHENPGEATLHVLLGRVRLRSEEETWEGVGDDHVAIPSSRHSLEAREDSVVLLTVVAAGRIGGSGP